MYNTSHLSFLRVKMFLCIPFAENLTIKDWLMDLNEISRRCWIFDKTRMTQVSNTIVVKILIFISFWVCQQCRIMVFNATLDNISVISWWSVLLVEDTGENHRPVVTHLETWSHMWHDQGWIQRGGAPRAPLKLEKIWFFGRKIVIFQTKYPKNFPASLRSAHFF
jgi:hypothetical protein